MKRCRIITISRSRALRLAAAALAVGPAVFAHAGFSHVMGTVARVSGNVVTIKTIKGDVDVKVSDKTEVTQRDRKAQIADLKPGTRVIVEVPEKSAEDIAQSLKIGVAPRPARHSHTK